MLLSLSDSILTNRTVPKIVIRTHRTEPFQDAFSNGNTQDGLIDII